MTWRTTLTRLAFLLLTYPILCAYAENGSDESSKPVSSPSAGSGAAASDQGGKSVWGPMGWGCAAGAAVGSVFPGIGTAVGCVVAGGGAALWQWWRQPSPPQTNPTSSSAL